MKRVLSLIIILITLCTPAYAESSGSTRQELCTAVAKAFSLKSDGLAPLMRYNDWFYVRPENRFGIAAVIKSKLYAPKGGSFLPNSQISKQDISVLAQGLAHYMGLNPQITLYKGTILEKKDGNVILASGSNRFTASDDCPYIDTKITTLGEYEAAGDIQFLAHKTGKVYMALPVISVVRAEFKVVKAKMYLFDFNDNTLIASQPSEYKNNKWTPVPNRMYVEAVIDDSVVIIKNGASISKNALNTQCLDSDIYLLYNEKNQLVYIQAS